MKRETVVEMRHITKQFGAFKAVDDVSLTLEKGEIHALLGENGAGKSTLMSVLFGLYTPEKGNILFRGDPVRIRTPNDADDLGIGMVHQHFKLVHNFTVLESIVLGNETVSHGFLRMKEARKKILKLSEQYGLSIDPDARISDITVGQQQRVEILKMLYRDNEVLIFDEPTAVLTPQEISSLMEIMKKLAAEGKSILFITHKLDEIKAVSDRCTILRKGKCIGTVDTATHSAEDLAERMVGRKVEFHVQKNPVQPGKEVLTVKDLTVVNRETKKNVVDHVTFSVREGEIVTVAGIDGNGQSELTYALTGLLKPNEGTVLLNGNDITKSSIKDRYTSGMSHIPEDRLRYGLVPDDTLAENLVLQEYRQDPYSKNGFLNFKEIEAHAEELSEEYDIRSSHGPSSDARGMSGGNQQKLVIARELDRDPSLLIASQPVRGLDIGAIEGIHNQLLKEREKGKGILLISFELEEVMNLSDRILVLFEGLIVADVRPEDITVQELGLYMAGHREGATA